jgi:hypothetical protein
MKFLFLLLLAIPAISLAYNSTPAEECSPIDLRNETLAENRNQQDVAWCYAFTAADMLGHTFDSTERMSAADIAIAYNQTKIAKLVRWVDVSFINRDGVTRASAHQTGFNAVALKKAMENGWCPESVFSSESWVKKTRTADGWKSESQPLAQAFLDIAVLHRKREKLNASNIPYFYSFKNIDAGTFVQILNTKKLPNVYAGLRLAACRDDRRPFDYNWKVKMVVKNPKIFSRISEQLETGRLVGLDYDSRILENRHSRGFKINELHTSSIVGRRWNPEVKSCEYLIRDSYGTKCEYNNYDPSYDCESGNVWLSESQIYTSMTSIVYMLSGK